ncbi:hypothetical protein ASE43_02810 [Lysobacter sp. Root983]|nr:hypothetical protein ASE43_02810 [Lysobacter sp. Root983]
MWPDGFLPLCAKHGLTKDEFCHAFARVVALEFAHGELSYAEGDAAMNCLFGIVDIDLRGFAWEIYHAFDAGEYQHGQDPPGTISWQKYTLPRVMEVLAAEGLLLRAYNSFKPKPLGGSTKFRR